jgi:hypothetical protein
VSKQLDLIGDQCPPWASIAKAGQGFVATAIALPSGKPFGPIRLQIKASNGVIDVQEATKPGTWPVGCPERHINHDGTFCIGEGRINSPKTATDADLWWQALGKFLIGQRFADRHRKWPYPRSLHHGAASIHQRNLESLAKGTCFEGDVDDALHAQLGWLAGSIPRLHRDGTRLVNLRSPCPRGCKKRKHPILRRKCKQRDLMFRLVKEEHLRRQAEQRFWDNYPRKICCGTMGSCPLLKDKNQ